jgi:two-component system response regulator HupR/HoxA
VSPDKTPVPPPKARGRVLVVDDDATARVTLEAILGEDFEVASADTAAAAKELLGRQAFDVLVTDHEMPGETGAELLAATRQRWPALVSILLTGHSDYAAVRDLQKAGRVLVLFKPVDPAQLVAWVKNGVVMASLTQATTRLHAMNDPKKKPRPDD